MSAYRYRVEIDHKQAYDGPAAVDAMAAWNKAVEDKKAEYICFEALRTSDEQLRKEDTA